MNEFREGGARLLRAVSQRFGWYSRGRGPEDHWTGPTGEEEAEQERWPKGDREPLSSEECGTHTKMKMQQNKWSQADGERG